MTSGTERGEEALQALTALHDELERETRGLAVVHGDRLQCRRGCHACCLDELTVTQIEAERIRRAHPKLLAEDTPHPVGACALLDGDGACRVYDERPSVCRSQGLPLRILFENEEEEIEEVRDICPLNLDGGPPLAALAEEDCWLVGPYDLRLASLDEMFGGNDESRVRLRDLFRPAAPVPTTSR